MYQLCLQREFDARHYLIGGDWGAENTEHGHPYRIEWILEAEELNRHGYLVDLVDVERHLEASLQVYRGRVLNDLPEFEGMNPSLENFARLLATRLADGVREERLAAHTVRLWEGPTAWASFRQPL